MVDGSVRSSTEPGAPEWDVVVGDRFIAALAAPASDVVMVALAEVAADPDAGLEGLVSRIPTLIPDASDAFAVAWWPGPAADVVAAVVRGNAVVDLASPGGSRRFDARGITPFHLAEFIDVTALRITAAGSPLWSGGVREADVAGAAIGPSRATFRASRIVWSSQQPAVVRTHTPATVISLTDAVADTVLTARSRAAAADTMRLRDRSADADTVLSRRRRPAWQHPDGVGATAAGEPMRGADIVGAPPQGHEAPDRPVDPTGAGPHDAAPRFRVGADDPRAVTAPVRIGRDPAAPRVAPVRPELVRVDSPRAIVSSTHLELRREGRRLVATDLRSTNGTIVRAPGGTRRMRSGESIVVAPGTSLDLGDGTIVEILPALGSFDAGTPPT